MMKRHHLQVKERMTANRKKAGEKTNTEKPKENVMNMKLLV